MHNDMMTGIANPVPDMAFARGMLPHHRGAVDMAMIQLQYGTDKEMRKLAQDIIDAQQPEIIWLQEWIAKTLVNAEKDASNATDQDTSANQKEAVEVAKTTKPNA